MTRPKLENYRSRQPGLPDYERFFGYIKALEEYCNYLEFQLEEMSKPQLIFGESLRTTAPLHSYVQRLLK